MHLTTIFFDLDDTLYPASSGLWHTLKSRMNDYMRDHLGFPEADIPAIRERYFMQYGTTLRGLQANHAVDTAHYLAYVHNVQLESFLKPDPVQRAVIAGLKTRNLIFTNADASHAGRVLAALNLDDLFEIVIDVNAVEPYCKPMPEAFSIAMRAAGVSDPAECAMIDDLPRTTRTARQLGMFSLLYGGASARPDADGAFTDWRELPALLNGRTG